MSWISRGGGAGSISLVGAEEEMTVREMNVDVRFFRRTGNWRSDIRGTYRREVADQDTTADVSFAGDAASQFAVQGLPLPINSFQGLFGLTMRTVSGLQYTVEYKMYLAPGESHHGIGFRMRFR